MSAYASRAGGVARPKGRWAMARLVKRALGMHKAQMKGRYVIYRLR
ncbi:hypothetical protein FHU30_007927 [Actinomadura rupiterrae]|nr:hypothetical protein [Actinomadura rupiterrae]